MGVSVTAKMLIYTQGTHRHTKWLLEYVNYFNHITYTIALKLF